MDAQYNAISTTMDALRGEVAEVATLKLARRLEVARRYDSMWHFVTMLAVSALVGPVWLLANPADYNFACTVLSSAAAVVAVWHFVRLVSSHTCIDMIDLRLAEIKSHAVRIPMPTPMPRTQGPRIRLRDVGVTRDPSDDRDGPVAPGGIHMEAAARSVA